MRTKNEESFDEDLTDGKTICFLGNHSAWLYVNNPEFRSFVQEVFG